MVKERGIYPTTKRPQTSSGSMRPINAIQTVYVALVWYILSKWPRLRGEDNKKITRWDFGKGVRDPGGLWWPIREAPPERVSFSGFRYMKGKGCYSLKYIKWSGICHLGLWKGPKGITDEFYGFLKSRKRCTLVIDSYLKDNAITAVKRDAMF